MTREEFQKQLPELVSNYRPALDVADHISRINVLMVVGPSGVGKTTLINELPIKHVLSDNSRPPRPGEREGVDFYFRSDYEQVIKELKGGRFVQAVIDSGGDLKATKATSYPDEGDVVMAVIADAIPIFRNFGFAKTTTAFITPPNYEEWMRRMHSHGLQGDELAKRMAEAKRSLSFALNDEGTHFILSDEIPATVKQLQDLADGRIDELRELKAQIAAEQILYKLNTET
jgi:guanylate kinase